MRMDIPHNHHFIYCGLNITTGENEKIEIFTFLWRFANDVFVFICLITLVIWHNRKACQIFGAFTPTISQNNDTWWYCNYTFLSISSSSQSAAKSTVLSMLHAKASSPIWVTWEGMKIDSIKESLKQLFPIVFNCQLEGFQKNILHNLKKLPLKFQ